MSSRVYAPPHVCAWWRRLVLQKSVPHPYYDIDVNVGKLVSLRQDSITQQWRYAFCEALGPILARLPYSELNMRINCFDDGGESCPTLNDTNVHPRLWRRAALLRLPLTRLLEVAQSDLPTLTDLHVMLGADSEEGNGFWTGLNLDDRPRLLGNAPQLRSLGLSKPSGFRMQRLPFSLPWTQLWHVRLSNIPLHASLEIIAECKSLRSFEWWDDREEEEIELQDVPPSGSRPISDLVTNSITELRIEVDSPGNISMGRLLARMSMPSLTTLHAACAPTGLLVSFIKQSGCRLTTLSLHASIYTMSSEDFPVIFDAVPELERLSFLYDTYFEDDWMPQGEGETMSLFLHALFTALCHVQPHPSTAHRYLPRLNTFFFRCPERCDAILLARMSLRGRIRKPDPRDLRKTAPVREVWLETPLNEEDVDFMRILSLAQGFELYGLNTCGALYDALLPHDWKPPLEVSRQDGPDGNNDGIMVFQ
ncbi:hypothetical protein K523DRAFT_352458 [Schizophyllum commune Tattone D]|nr:hypothetical protein K523DRAFT_352458 [Schizophyllum commune Tattone D]